MKLQRSLLTPPTKFRQFNNRCEFESGRATEKRGKFSCLGALSEFRGERRQISELSALAPRRIRDTSHTSDRESNESNIGRLRMMWDTPRLSSVRFFGRISSTIHPRIHPSNLSFDP